MESLDSLILCYFENGHFQNRLHDSTTPRNRLHDSTTPRSKLSQQATPHYFAIGQIRSRVALVGLQKMLQVRLSGPCQADESFVRCARKHNVGRINPGRKHTLVILIYFFFTFNGNAGVIVAYPLGIHSVYHPLNLSSHVIMRYSVYGILFKNTWWLLEFLIGRLRLCGLSFITSATWASK